MKELFIIFDFNLWQQGSSWSFVSSYALYLERKKRESDKVEILIIPYWYPPNVVKNVIDLKVKNGMFERAFIFIPHLNITSQIIKKLRRRKIEIVFIVTESLVYSPKEVSHNSIWGKRYQHFVNLLHKKDLIITFCFESYFRLKNDSFQAFFVNGFIPSKEIIENYDTFLTESKKNSASKKYALLAKIYNVERQEIYDSLSVIFDFFSWTEVKNSDPLELTDELEMSFQELINLDMSMSKDYYIFAKDSSEKEGLMNKIIMIRYKLWMHHLRNLNQASVIVSLPSFFKGFVGRVIDGIILNKYVYVLTSDESNHNLSIENSNIFIINKRNFKKIEYDLANQDIALKHKQDLSGFVNFNQFIDSMSK